MIKKIKCRVKSGRGDGADHKWENFLESAYDGFKAACDEDAAVKAEVVEKFNSVFDGFGDELVTSKMQARMIWGDLEDDDQQNAIIDALFGADGFLDEEHE